MSQPPTEPKKVTLKEWIDNNEKLLTVTGVFAALTAYFSTLKATYLSLLTFALFLLLLIEAWISLPKNQYRTFRLTLFFYGLNFLVVYVGLFILRSYQDILVKTSFGWIYLLGAISCLWFVNNRWWPTLKISKRMQTIVACMIVLGLPALVALVISTLLMRFFHS